MDVEFIGNNRRREAAQACEDCSIPAVMVASLTATTSFHRHLIICPPLWRRKPLQYISHVHADIGGGVKTRTKTLLSVFHKLLIFKTSSSVYLYVSVLGLELHWNIIKMVKTNTIRHLCLQPSCGAAAQSLQKSRGAWPADTTQDVMWKTSRDTASMKTAQNWSDLVRFLETTAAPSKVGRMPSLADFSKQVSHLSIKPTLCVFQYDSDRNLKRTCS